MSASCALPRCLQTDAPSRPALSAHTGDGEVLLADVMCRVYQGVSPYLARELLLAAELDPMLPASRADEAALAQLHPQWRRWLEALQQGSFAPGQLPDGSVSVLGGLPGSLPPAHCGDVLALLAWHFAPLEGEAQLEDQRGNLLRQLAVAVKRSRGKVQGFEKKLEEAGQADELSHQGDLLVASIWRVRATAGRADVGLLSHAAFYPPC